jgi:hypothetical protein
MPSCPRALMPLPHAVTPLPSTRLAELRSPLPDPQACLTSRVAPAPRSRAFALACRFHLDPRVRACLPGARPWGMP